eukprot:scaffold4026_cov117-Cylindrotheca_fusiformis.AAC.36
MSTSDELLNLRVKRRFDLDFEPKYGVLWREMAKRAQLRPSNSAPAIDFAQAVEQKIPVSLTCPASHERKCDCGCAPPILESNNREYRSGPNNSTFIDLVESSDDSDGDCETKEMTEKVPTVEASKDVYLLSLSEEESIDNPTSPSKMPQRTRRRRQWKDSFQKSDDSISGSSDGSSFEPEADVDVDSMDELINATQDCSINSDKENKRTNTKSVRKQLGSWQRNIPPMSKAAFKKRRKELANKLYSEFNQKAFEGKLEHVHIGWSTKLRTTAGLTRLKRSQQNMRPGTPQLRYATIELSTKVLDSRERLEATLLHEMVHAAAWVFDAFANPPHGDGFWKWARIAMSRIPGIVITTTHSYEIQYKYAWVSCWLLICRGFYCSGSELLTRYTPVLKACSKPGCGFVVKRQSKSVNVKKHCCGRCKSSLFEINALTADSNPAPKKRTAPSGYNLFVKEKSKTVREMLVKKEKEKGNLNPKVSQKQVMKECARLWHEKKTTISAPTSIS